MQNFSHPQLLFLHPCKFCLWDLVYAFSVILTQIYDFLFCVPDNISFIPKNSLPNNCTGSPFPGHPPTSSLTQILTFSPCLLWSLDLATPSRLAPVNNFCELLSRFLMYVSPLLREVVSFLGGKDHICPVCVPQMAHTDWGMEWVLCKCFFEESLPYIKIL